MHVFQNLPFDTSGLFNPEIWRKEVRENLHAIKRINYFLIPRHTKPHRRLRNTHGSETKSANSCFWRRVLQERLRNEHSVCKSCPFRVTSYFFFNKINITKIKNVPQAPKYVGHPEEVVWIALEMKPKIKCLDHSFPSSACQTDDFSGGFSLPHSCSEDHADSPEQPSEARPCRPSGRGGRQWHSLTSPGCCSGPGLLKPCRAVVCPSPWHAGSM